MEVNRLCHTNLDFAERDGNGNTALHYAATGGDFFTYSRGKPENMITLLNSGNVNLEILQNGKGETPLHQAMKGHNLSMVQAILTDRSVASKMITKTEYITGLTPMGAFIEWCYDFNYIDEELFLSMVTLPGITFSVFTGGKELNNKQMDNGLITLLELDDKVATKLYKNKSFRLKGDLADMEDKDGTPLLCLAVSKKWSPELVALILENTSSSDWKKITMRVGSKRLNAIEIMRKNHTEYLYEDIFNEYM